MTHDDPFGQLRSLMNHPNWTHTESYQLGQLVTAFASTHPIQYQQVWLPYMHGFTEKWANEIFYCESIPTFETLARLLPNAKIGLLINQNMLRDHDLQALAQMPHLDRVVSLNWSYNRIGDDGAIALAQAPFTQLEVLYLGAFQQVGDFGFSALCHAPWGAQLKLLDVSGPITDEGLRALANSTTLTALETLWLTATELTVHGVNLLANAPHLSTLKELFLPPHLLTPEARQALLNSPFIQAAAFEKFLVDGID